MQGPSVFPLAPCSKSPAGGAASVTLGCLVRDYFPEPVTVTWDAGSLTTSVVTLPAAFSSGLYTTSSQVTASGEWAKQRFTCSVVHPAGSTTVNKTIDPAPACATNVTLPTVRLYHSSCDPSGNTQATIQLLCLISGFTPGDLEVTWLVDGQTENLFPITGPASWEGALASTFSQLNISQGEWLSQRTYTCQASLHGCTVKADARTCPGTALPAPTPASQGRRGQARPHAAPPHPPESEPRGVSVYVIPPSPLDLYVHKSPKVACLVVDLASLEGMSLQWSREGGGLLTEATQSSKRHFNMTYSVTSTLPVDASDWIEGETYECRLSHPDLPQDIVRTIAKAPGERPGKRAAPEVFVFPPPKEQGAQDTLTLTCLIQSFFPADISVQWLQDKVLIQSDQHATTRPLRDPGASPAFFVFSRLKVSRADWEKRSNFTCRVTHEALADSRTREQSVSKDPELDLQDLCVGAAEGEELEGLWRSLFVFIALFLLSVTYGASVTLFKVQWVLGAVLQGPPQATHDYENIEDIARPAAWTAVGIVPSAWGCQGSHSVSCVVANPSSPTLFPLSLRTTDPAGHVVIGCLVQDFFPPEPMKVTWGSSGPGTSIRNFLPVLNSRGLYTMVSQLTLPADQCPTSATQKCHVQHNSSPNQTKDVPCKVTPKPTSSCCQPRLTLRPPALEDLLLGSNANLTCTLSGLREPQGASFTWQPTGGKEAIQEAPQRDACGCYSVSSVLPGCAEPWNRGQRFSCTAAHPEAASPLTATIARASGPPAAAAPSEELALNELVTLTCVVRGFYPEDVLVRWLHESQELPREKYQTWSPLPEAGQGGATFATTSVLRVDTEAWKNGDNYSCMVGHEALPLSFTQKTINRLAGKPTHVNVSVVMSEVDGICY
ncbi:hypothetical protein QTO34_012560 [Cnephaeus nilssonii]|uniref:Ig-like domain-containing protein n=1 Tax=Cnephaeus nilssonii TaxID=3371016 RepID=A0AA40HC41_CNENI|nr:hypothetical protein QTO34_012560 [Eptesicus nilssonii]